MRYQFDDGGHILVQKLGGWTAFYPSALPAVARALWAWEDINIQTHLAFGTQNISTSAELGVITAGTLQNITPTITTDNVTPAAASISGSPVIKITDATTTGISSFDTVYIETHLSIGGVVLFGLYPTTEFDSTHYEVTALDILGNLEPATGSSSSASVALFTTTNASNVVTVTLDAHGYVAGDTYPVLVSTAVGGITLYGNYIVQSVVDANNFTINAAQTASSSTTGSINGGNARYLYSFGVGAIPAGSGYGAGGYGSGGYGTGAGITPAVGTAISAHNWTLDNFGQILLACPINGTLFQPVFMWDPTSGSPIATVIPQAPPLNDGILVAMPQRQVVAWGSTQTGIQDPLLINWCDVNNFNQWIALVTNQAGSYRIPKGSKIVGAIQGPQQILVWTDIDIWSMQYSGPPYIYAFNEIGSGCGLISRKAAASANGVIYWMGPSQFFSLSAYGVQPVSCPVWDVMFQDLDQSNLDKIRVAVNSRFNEIAWYYPTMGGSGEVTAFVKYNYAIGYWDYGTLGRSAWIDQSVLGAPIGADPSTLLLFQHETSPDANGQPMTSGFQTGYFAINEGDQLAFVDQFWSDAKWGTYGGTMNATLTMTLYGVNYPGDTPIAYGPFTLMQSTKFVTPRIRKRLISVAIQSADLGSFWRMGRFRFRFKADGSF